jgi:hypothetical protein
MRDSPTLKHANINGSAMPPKRATLILYKLGKRTQRHATHTLYITPSPPTIPPHLIMPPAAPIPTAPAPPQLPPNPIHPNGDDHAPCTHPCTPTPGDHPAPQNIQKSRARANIVIASLNMNGFTAPTEGLSGIDKWSMINQSMNKNKIAILALQETHLDPQRLDDVQACFSRKMSIITSVPTSTPRASAGVAFVQ